MSANPDTLDGRLLAPRKVLARLVAALDGPAGDELRDYIRDRSHMIADEEDPGAVPGEGVGEGGIVGAGLIRMHAAFGGAAGEKRPGVQNFTQFRDRNIDVHIGHIATRGG